MVSDTLQNRIYALVRRINKEYHCDQGVKAKQIESIQRNNYIERIISLSEVQKNEIMDILESSLDENHGNIDNWKCVPLGISLYLLLFTHINEVDIGYANDVVVRISHWYHTNVINIWKRFVPYASSVVQIAWGGIEDIHGT